MKTSSRGSQQLASSDVPGFETCYIVYTEPPLNLGTPSHYVITNLIPYKATRYVLHTVRHALERQGLIKRQFVLFAKQCLWDHLVDYLLTIHFWMS